MGTTTLWRSSMLIWGIFPKNPHLRVSFIWMIICTVFVYSALGIRKVCTWVRLRQRNHALLREWERGRVAPMGGYMFICTMCALPLPLCGFQDSKLPQHAVYWESARIIPGCSVAFCRRYSSKTFNCASRPIEEELYSTIPFILFYYILYEDRRDELLPL